MAIIEIRLHEDLPTSSQNRLRCAMEMAEWGKQWRKAQAEHDYAAMGRLDHEYEVVSLP